MSRLLRALRLAVPALAGLTAIAWWWTWNSIETRIRRAWAADRYRITRRGARLL